MSDYLWAKVIWGILLCIAAFIAGLLGWLDRPPFGKRKDDQ